jgi:hypothetical protein
MERWRRQEERWASLALGLAAAADKRADELAMARGAQAAAGGGCNLHSVNACKLFP